jgi:hypothetical protein
MSVWEEYNAISDSSGGQASLPYELDKKRTVWDLMEKGWNEMSSSVILSSQQRFLHGEWDEGMLNDTVIAMCHTKSIRCTYHFSVNGNLIQFCEPEIIELRKNACLYDERKVFERNGILMLI